VRPRAGGRVRVAWVGSNEVAVADVARETLAFGPGGTPPVGRIELRDVSGDGLPDLVARFRMREAAIENEDEEACLRGELGGLPFVACDAVVTIP
jgi:hypothetical protein